MVLKSEFLKTHPISAVAIGLMSSLVARVDRTAHHTAGVQLNTGLKDNDINEARINHQMSEIISDHQLLLYQK